MPIESRNGRYRVYLSRRGWPRLSHTVGSRRSDAEPLNHTLEQLVSYERRDLAAAIREGQITLPALHHALMHDKTKRIDTITLADVICSAGGANEEGEVPVEVQLGPAVEAWLTAGRNWKNKELRPDTLARYRTSFDVLFRWMGHGDPEAGRREHIATLWSVDVLLAYAKARRDAEQGPTLSRHGRVATGPTVNRDQDAFGAFRRWAQQSTTYSRLVAGLAEPKRPRDGEHDGRDRYLRPHEYARVTEYCETVSPKPSVSGQVRNLRHWLVAFDVLRYAGPRTDEMQRLVLANLDLDSPTPALYLEGDTMRGELASRSVPVAAPLLARLRWWLEERRRLGYADAPDAPLFPGVYGSYQNLFKAWDYVRTRTGLEDVTLHDLRHTFGVYLARGGATLPVIQRLLGHRSAEMTQRYTNYQPAHELRVAVEQATLVAAGHGQTAAAVLANPEAALDVLVKVLGAPHLRTMLASAATGNQAANGLNFAPDRS